MLACLTSHIHLEQDPRTRAFLVRDPLQIFGEAKRVDAVKQLEKRKRLPDFILLQRPDEMPAPPRGKERQLDPRFLHPALAEDSLAREFGGVDFLRVLFFRNGPELDLLRRAAGSRRRRRY